MRRAGAGATFAMIEAIIFRGAQAMLLFVPSTRFQSSSRLVLQRKRMAAALAHMYIYVVSGHIVHKRQHTCHML